MVKKLCQCLLSIPHNAMCVQAEAALLTITDQLQSYVVARTPLLPLAQTGSLVFDLLHECSSHQTTIISSTQFLVYVAAALKGEETDGNVLGSLATALQATAEMMSAAEGEREEREREENTWRTEILRELSVSVMKDAARSVLMHYTSCISITLCVIYVLLFHVSLLLDVLHICTCTCLLVAYVHVCRTDWFSSVWYQLLQYDGKLTTLGVSVLYTM